MMGSQTWLWIIGRTKYDIDTILENVRLGGRRFSAYTVGLVTLHTFATLVAE